MIHEWELRDEVARGNNALQVIKLAIRLLNEAGRGDLARMVVAARDNMDFNTARRAVKSIGMQNSSINIRN